MKNKTAFRKPIVDCYQIQNPSDKSPMMQNQIHVTSYNMHDKQLTVACRMLFCQQWIQTKCRINITICTLWPIGSYFAPFKAISSLSDVWKVAFYDVTALKRPNFFISPGIWAFCGRKCISPSSGSLGTNSANNFLMITRIYRKRSEETQRHTLTTSTNSSKIVCHFQSLISFSVAWHRNLHFADALCSGMFFSSQIHRFCQSTRHRQWRNPTAKSNPPEFSEPEHIMEG